MVQLDKFSYLKEGRNVTNYLMNNAGSNLVRVEIKAGNFSGSEKELVKKLDEILVQLYKFGHRMQIVEKSLKFRMNQKGSEAELPIEVLEIISPNNKKISFEPKIKDTTEIIVPGFPKGHLITLDFTDILKELETQLEKQLISLEHT